jgi:hypothetical protein
LSSNVSAPKHTTSAIKIQIALPIYYELRGRKQTGNRSKLHIMQLHRLYTSSNIIRVIKSWTVTRMGHTASMRRERHTFGSKT